MSKKNTKTNWPKRYLECK